jgi:HEAT repeat protein
LVEIAEASFEVDFNAVFRFCLKDEDEKVRGMAIEGLWEDEDVSLIDPLINMMREDPSIQVRAKAATSLGRFVLLGELREIDTEKAAVVSEALLGVILSPNEDVEVRRRAVESIAYLSDERVREIIEAAYYDDDERMRVSAVFAMGRSADPLWSSIVLRELESPYPEMRYEAARACGELEISDAVPILANLVEDQDREVQEAAIWALGNIGGNEARRILESCYVTGDDFLREAVEEALDQLELLSASFNIPFHELESDVYEDADPYFL